MKRALHCILFISVLSSCLSESLINTETINGEIKITQATQEIDTYFVDLQDVYKYVDFKILEARSKGRSLELNSIDSILSATNHISMYVINYNEGWDVISADKRSPMVLASSDHGVFEHSSDDPRRLYFDMVAEDVRSFTSNENKYQIMTKTLSEESEENVIYWDAITASDEFIQNNLPNLITPPDTLILTPMGRWELVDVESTKEIYDFIDHLISLEWGQDNPFNAYCPMSTTYLGSRAPAGCVAVSGAQTLTYLQDFLNLEIDVPATVTVNGNIDSFYINFTDYGTALWETIKSPEYLVANYAAAKLISYTGYLVGMEYGNDISLASTEDLKSKVFEPMGIACNHGDFDASVVKSNLLNNLPVIISARKEDNSSGHSFNDYQMYYLNI